MGNPRSWVFQIERSVISMIRNILLMKHGVPLFNEYFGKCHTIMKDDLLMSGFLDAISSFSQQVFGSSVEQVGLENYTILIRRNNDDLVTVFICDKKDDLKTAKMKIERVTELFNERYGDLAVSFQGGQSNQFRSFRNVLLKRSIVEKNCGERPECDDCPNSKTSKPFLEKIRSFGRVLLNQREK